MKTRPSGRNEAPTVVVVDKYSKLPLFDGDRQFVDDNEEVGGNEGVIEDACEGLANDNVVIEGFGEEQQYPTRERQPLGD